MMPVYAWAALSQMRRAPQTIDYVGPRARREAANAAAQLECALLAMAADQHSMLARSRAAMGVVAQQPELLLTEELPFWDDKTLLDEVYPMKIASPNGFYRVTRR